MFERFTDVGRQVMATAQSEARALRHNYVGTEHVLLALLSTDSAAAQALTAQGVTHEVVRDRVLAIEGAGSAAVPSSGQVPFHPRTKKVMELALREALPFGHNFIGPEHLLLGIVTEGEGVAARTLDQLGFDAEPLRTTLAALPPTPGPVIAEARGRVAAARRDAPEAGMVVRTQMDPGGFTVRASEPVVGLLMNAASQALREGRTEFTVADVRSALIKHPDSGDPPEKAAG